jgi:hypothetical protein
MKPCFCGSGLSRRELKDGHGIFLTFACDKCERAKLSEFRPDIMTQYDADEPIDDPDGEGPDPMRGVEFPFAENH